MSHSFFDNHEDSKPEPIVGGWQLIGDSQFLRFSEKFLGKTRKKKDKLAYLGLCVSGQKVADLLDRVKEQFKPISNRVIIMIGTNDLLQGTNVTMLRADLEKLIIHLRNIVKVSDIIVLTIPPVPRLAKSPDHWKTIKSYNDHIRSFAKGGKIKVIDAYASFIKNDELSRSSLSLSRNSLSSSRSSLVSYSSGSSNPLLRNSNDSLNIPCYTSNIGKIRKNLRIQVGDTAKERNIFILDSDNEEEDNSDDSENDCDKLAKLTPSRKRSRFSIDSTAPNAKRRSQGSGSYDIAQDDHDDSFYSGSNSEPVDQAEEIIFDYFEKFFDQECNRPDLIHLNLQGFGVIKRLINDAISVYDL